MSEKLENTIIRLMLMAESEVVMLEDLGMAPAGKLAADRPFKAQVEHEERRLIEQMVEENASSRRIARALGVSHTTVLNKIRSYQLESV
ncbi:Transcriptional regulator of aromatic amino acids metabolism [Yokenella regensburgei]|nr:Transcriptional regulator of aromatic amino acids metabolism [Yokenella regensburgei]